MINICAICAWRQTCQKKFSVSGRSMYCPDFVRDVTIKEDKGKESAEDLKEKEERDGSEKA
jgi:hypothetical protein